MPQCRRHNVAGHRCQNDTENRDGWCRQSACDGFSRATTQNAPELKGVKFYGSPEEVAATKDNPARLRDDPWLIAIDHRAIDRFVFHHGGTKQDAEMQIRVMLIDFMQQAGKVVTEKTYLALSLDGYRLMVSPERNRVTGYSTAHRERTWEQIKMGIPSRIGDMDLEPMPVHVPSEQNKSPANKGKVPSTEGATTKEQVKKQGSSENSDKGDTNDEPSVERDLGTPAVSEVTEATETAATTAVRRSSERNYSDSDWVRLVCAVLVGFAAGLLSRRISGRKG